MTLIFQKALLSFAQIILKACEIFSSDCIFLQNYIDFLESWADRSKMKLPRQNMMFFLSVPTRVGLPGPPSAIPLRYLGVEITPKSTRNSLCDRIQATIYLALSGEMITLSLLLSLVEPYTEHMFIVCSQVVH